MDFLKSIVLNSVFPFVVALLVSFFVNKDFGYFFSFFFQPGVVLSAFGAQFAAYMFSYCFRTMTVKEIAITAKSADLFIPIIVFFITNKFVFSDYLFAVTSTLIFTPIMLGIFNNTSTFYPLVSFLLLAVLFFQTGINSYFKVYQFADTWPKFLSMMACILLWRSIFILAPLILYRIKNYKVSHKEKEHCEYSVLAVRAILAFVSQATFFFSITRISGNIAWPILNSTPLIACFSAHILLNEKIGKTELLVLFAFLVLSFIYICINWSLIT